MGRGSFVQRIPPTKDYRLGEKATEVIGRFTPNEFIVTKDDGSLDRGFEIVTAPATLEEQLAHWKPFFARLPSGLRSFSTCTCGLHIHCSRRPLTELTIAKIVCFTNANFNRPFVECIAGRPSGRWANIWPKKLSDARKINPERYEAVNLQNYDTIEFRIFKGTLKEQSFYKALWNPFQSHRSCRIAPLGLYMARHMVMVSFLLFLIGLVSGRIVRDFDPDLGFEPHLGGLLSLDADPRRLNEGVKVGIGFLVFRHELNEHLVARGNPDGAGFAVSDGVSVEVRKGFFNYKDFMKEVEPFMDYPLLIHFRLATHGAKNERNCHPFTLRDGSIAVVHNGIINIQSDKENSDTANFVKLVMDPLDDKFGIQSSLVKYLIEEAIGYTNKIACMMPDGHPVIFNENAGTHEGEIWFSNSGYKEAPLFRRGSTVGKTYGAYGLCDRFGWPDGTDEEDAIFELTQEYERAGFSYTEARKAATNDLLGNLDYSG